MNLCYGASCRGYEAVALRIGAEKSMPAKDAGTTVTDNVLFGALSFSDARRPPVE